MEVIAVLKMKWKRVVYHIAVIVAALGMFLPLLYGAVPIVRELLGSNPLIKSVTVITLSWLIAYLTFGDGKREELTAS